MTILRSYFYLAGQHVAASPGASPMVPPLADATTAIEDLCILFSLMRELLHVQNSPASVSVVLVSSVLQALSEDAEAILAGTGLRFAVEEPGLGRTLPVQGCESAMPPSVSIDSQRVRSALASMLHIASESSGPEAVVHCRVTEQDAWVTLLIVAEQSSAAPRKYLSSEAARLHLALVEANLAGQQARFDLTDEPRMLSLKLPLASAQS